MVSNNKVASQCNRSRSRSTADVAAGVVAAGVTADLCRSLRSHVCLEIFTSMQQISTGMNMKLKGDSLSVTVDRSAPCYRCVRHT